MTCTMIQQLMPGSRQFARPFSPQMLSLHYVACMQTGVLNGIVGLYQTIVPLKNQFNMGCSALKLKLCHGQHGVISAAPRKGTGWTHTLLSIALVHAALSCCLVLRGKFLNSTDGRVTTQVAAAADWLQTNCIRASKSNGLHSQSTLGCIRWHSKSCVSSPVAVQVLFKVTMGPRCSQAQDAP